MYVVPTQPLESLKMPINLNQIVLAGNVGYIFDQVREDAFNFGMMLKAPPQKALGHTWQDSLGFKCESWGDDAKRLMRFIYEGSAISLGGTLKFETWIDKDGNRRNQYKVRVRSMQYQFHGKKEENAEIEEKIEPVEKDLEDFMSQIEELKTKLKDVDDIKELNFDELISEKESELESQKENLKVEEEYKDNIRPLYNTIYSKLKEYDEETLDHNYKRFQECKEDLSEIKSNVTVKENQIKQNKTQM